MPGQELTCVSPDRQEACPEAELHCVHIVPVAVLYLESHAMPPPLVVPPVVVEPVVLVVSPGTVTSPKGVRQAVSDIANSNAIIPFDVRCSDPMLIIPF